jgi:hypothetical protein
MARKAEQGEEYSPSGLDRVIGMIYLLKEMFGTIRFLGEPAHDKK